MLSHQPHDILVVDEDALGVQLSRHPPIAASGPLGADLLDARRAAPPRSAGRWARHSTSIARGPSAGHPSTTERSDDGRSLASRPHCVARSLLWKLVLQV